MSPYLSRGSLPHKYRSAPPESPSGRSCLPVQRWRADAACRLAWVSSPAATVAPDTLLDGSDRADPSAWTQHRIHSLSISSHLHRVPHLFSVLTVEVTWCISVSSSENACGESSPLRYSANGKSSALGPKWARARQIRTNDDLFGSPVAPPPLSLAWGVAIRRKYHAGVRCSCDVRHRNGFDRGVEWQPLPP